QGGGSGRVWHLPPPAEVEEHVELLPHVHAALRALQHIDDLQHRRVTRSVLSPVSDFFGTTNGSTRTNRSRYSCRALPRLTARAGNPVWKRSMSCSLMSTRTCSRPSCPSTTSAWPGCVPTYSPGWT